MTKKKDIYSVKLIFSFILDIWKLWFLKYMFLVKFIKMYRLVCRYNFNRISSAWLWSENYGNTSKIFKINYFYRYMYKIFSTKRRPTPPKSINFRSKTHVNMLIIQSRFISIIEKIIQVVYFDSFTEHI